MKLIDRLISTLVLATVGMAVLVAAGPTVVQLAHTLIWLALVVGLVGGFLRLVFYFTRP